MIEGIEDFGDIQIFPGRTTYTTILLLQRNRGEFEYRAYRDFADAEVGHASEIAHIKSSQISQNAWSFDDPDLNALHTELVARHGTLGDIAEIDITVGLQTLYGKYYQFKPIKVTTQTVTGVNGAGVSAQLERKALRPLCRNRGFYPFREDNADAWVIFPYEIKSGEFRELLWPEFEQTFPKTAKYLADAKREIQKAVETEKGNRWHLYLYPKNLVSQAQPKVLFPATVEDTLATTDVSGEVYQDNVRVQALTCSRPIDHLAIAALFNSTAFNALAKLHAGLSDSGWRQLNRQFIAKVPFPRAVLEEQNIHVKTLATLAQKITERQNALLATQGEGERAGLIATLNHLWQELDFAAENIYALTESEKEVIRRYPRKVNRVEMLLRQG